MADVRHRGSRVVYRCHGCELEFGVGSVGALPCPRCSCIGDHDRVETLAGATDNEP